MRRAAALAVVLVMAFSGVAMAKGPADKVTGDYTYINLANGLTRAVTLHVKATDPVRGDYTWESNGQYFSGPVTCAIVDGPDAWLAGPITEGTFTDGLGFFFRLHDGGRHGAGDWALQGYDAYEAQLAWCLSKDTSYDEPHDQFPMTSGDLVVKDK